MENPDVVVGALVEAGLVDSARAAEARDVVAQAAARSQRLGGPRTGRLTEIAAYTGGALVVAAGGILVANEWAGLSGATRLTALGVVALLLAAAGTAVRAARLPSDTGRRLAGTLLTGAAALGGFAVGLGADLAGARSEWPGVLGVAAAVVLGSLAYRFARTALGLLLIAIATVTLLPLLADLAGSPGGSLSVGVAEVAAAVGWLVLAERGLFREALVATVVGCAWALGGAQAVLLDTSHDWVGYLLTALVAAAGFGVYLLRLAWPYVAVGVAGITLVVPEVVTHQTSGTLGPAGAVLLAGLALLGGALAGWWIHRERVSPV
jgi:hypothetical protein